MPPLMFGAKGGFAAFQAREPSRRDDSRSFVSFHFLAKGAASLCYEIEVQAAHSASLVLPLLLQLVSEYVQ